VGAPRHRLRTPLVTWRSSRGHPAPGTGSPSWSAWFGCHCHTTERWGLSCSLCCLAVVTTTHTCAHGQESTGTPSGEAQRRPIQVDPVPMPASDVSSYSCQLKRKQGPGASPQHPGVAVQVAGRPPHKVHSSAHGPFGTLPAAKLCGRAQGLPPVPGTMRARRPRSRAPHR